MPNKKITRAGVLLWGDDGFVLREEALALCDDVQPVEVDAREWEGGETADLSTPSLFGGRRALLVSESRSLPEQARREVAGYLSAPAPDAILVATAVVAERGKPPVWLTKLFEGVGEIRAVSVGRKDLASWLSSRAKARGLEMEPRVPAALVDILGEDAAELDQAVQQLAGAFPGQRITVEMAASQFRGLGEQKVWDLCDKAFARDLPGAMRALESLLAAREEPLMILGGIAARLRELLKVRAVADKVSLKDLAREAGLRFDWQAKRYKEQAGNYSLEQLVRLHARMVDADRQLKSGASGGVVLAVVVTAISEGRG